MAKSHRESNETITLPVDYGNDMMAKADALDELIEQGVIDKETVLNVSKGTWFGERLEGLWR